jgi:NAD(P)-dependent dehydrogenase (short-subunit alcohol dehydrogenase family)
MAGNNHNNHLPPLSRLISLEKKRAMITGAGAGIGKAIAYRYAEAGADLELVDINDKSLETVKKELSQFKVNVGIHKVDVSKKEEIDTLWHGFDGNAPCVLVNNAGIYPSKKFLEVDQAFLKKVFDVNLNSAFWMCQNMIEKRLNMGGIIINIGSIEALLPLKKDLAHYSMSKAAVIALTRALAKEYARQGFRVNAIVPGGTMTQGTKNMMKELYKLNFGLVKTGLQFEMRLPIGRFGQPDDIARVALFLASELSSYVHGALVVVDGGFLSA